MTIISTNKINTDKPGGGPSVLDPPEKESERRRFSKPESRQNKFRFRKMLSVRRPNGE
jgi:hypothetical protein